MSRASKTPGKSVPCVSHEQPTLDIALRYCPHRLVLAPAAASLRRVWSRNEEEAGVPSEATLVEVSWGWRLRVFVIVCRAGGSSPTQEHGTSAEPAHGLFCSLFSIYEKLIQFCAIDELGTNYPKVCPILRAWRAVELAVVGVTEGPWSGTARSLWIPTS